MKLFWLCMLILFGVSVSAQKNQSSQVSYYKGEWSRTGASFSYSAFVKLTVTGNKVEGEILWKLLSGDSLNTETYPYFQSRIGLTAIEKFTGSVNRSTGDIDFRGIDKADPNNIIGLDEYALKWASGNKAIYGRTSSDGRWTGSFYAVRLDPTSASKEFSALAKTIKKKEGLD